MKKQKKIIIILIIAITIILTLNISKSVSINSNDIDKDTITTQSETFGINSFIENSKQYSGEFFNNIDINEILNSAIKGEIDNSNLYKKVLNLLGDRKSVV